jgi:hypothetical protein
LITERKNVTVRPGPAVEGRSDVRGDRRRAAHAIPGKRHVDEVPLRMVACRVTAYVIGPDRQVIMPTRRLPANGLDAFEEVLRGNYEGMVAKDPASAYTPGRTLSWLKVKQRGYRQAARGFDQR